MSNERTRKIIQISDTHIGKNPNFELLGVRTDESLKEVYKQLARETTPDCLLITGDLSQDGSLKSYQRIAEFFKDYEAPIYCFPGNHDDTKHLNLIYPLAKMQVKKNVILEPWQLVLLNTQKDRHVDGFLETHELNFLEECLRKHPDLYTFISFHHQPVEIKSEWLDPLGLKNSHAFWEIVKKYPNVKVVLFGHIHQQFDEEVNQIRCLATPSTSIQFKPKAKSFMLDPIPPGYRILELKPNGEIETEVKRLPKYVGYFDENAKGY